MNSPILYVINLKIDIIFKIYYDRIIKICIFQHLLFFYQTSFIKLRGYLLLIYLF
jgi:hypothetical protein